MVRRVGSETVLLNLETGHYHGLDSVGGEFLAVLTSEADTEGAVAVLSQTYSVPPERLRGDLAAFCGELAERGLVVVDDSRGG